MPHLGGAFSFQMDNKNKSKKEKGKNKKLRLLFGEIISARSFMKVLSIGGMYVKHFTSFDTSEMDELGEEHYEYAEKKGLPTESKQLEYLNEKEIWTEKDEENFTGVRKRISQLLDSKEKLFTAAERKPIEKEIEDLTLEDASKAYERKLAVGMCCETYSEEKLNQEFVFHGIYKDKSLKERYYTNKEFDELSKESLDALSTAYRQNQGRFDEKNLKRVGLSGFFLNFFYLCNDNPYVFWGIPTVQLTYYQATLFTHAKFFKNTLSQSKHKPPSDIFQDPDELINWMSSANQAEEMMEHLDNKGKERQGKEKIAGATSLVGATKKDLEFLGIDTETQGISLAKEAQKKGGTLDMADMLKIHGIS